MQCFELSNGLKVYVDKRESETVGMAIAIGVGSLYEDPEKRGLSHLIEHMLFKSNEKYSALEISKIIEYSGGEANAFISYDAIIIVAEVLPDVYSRVIDVLYSMYVNNKYLEKEFEDEKHVVLTEVKKYMNNPEDWISYLGLIALFGKSDYGDPCTGYPETLENISLDETLEFKEKHFIAENTVVVLTGAVSNKIIEETLKYFSNVPSGKVYRKKPVRSESREIVEKRDDIDQAYLSFAATTPGYTVPNYIISDYLTFNLTEGATSLPYTKLREERGLVYDFYSEYDLFADLGYLQVTIPGIPLSRLDEVISLTEDILNQIKLGEIESDYFEKRIKYYEYTIKTSYRSMFSRALLEAHTAIKGSIVEPEYFIEKLFLEKLYDSAITSNFIKALILPN